MVLYFKPQWYIKSKIEHWIQTSEGLSAVTWYSFTVSETHVQEPWEHLSWGPVAADAEQSVQHHGQPGGSGHELWPRLQRRDSEGDIHA